MEPWQYSALQSQFSSLIQLLSGNSKSTRSTEPSIIQQQESMNIDQASGDTMKIGMKRKLNDPEIDSIDPSKKNSRHSLNSRFSGTLSLDMYTQTDMSFLSSNYTTLAHIVDVVEENRRKLVSVEKFLSSINEKISMLQCASESGKRSINSETITPATTVSPSSTDNTLDATVDDSMQAAPTMVDKMSFPPNEQSSSSWIFNQEKSSEAKPARRESTVDLSLSKSLDMGGQEIVANALVPVIFASDNKTKRASTAEIPLQDLLNGNIVNPEDNVPMFRGCWLGDRLVPDSRAWYFGDSKVIQRAEASGTNPAKLSLNLVEALFTRDEMAASNVNGARGRELLDPVKIKAVYAHVNYKFPTDADKQEMRWHLLKPRIDSKCRAQRRIKRDGQVNGHNRSGQSGAKEKPFRSNLSKPILDPNLKHELLYGVGNTDSEGSSRQNSLTYIKLETSDNDDSNSNFVEHTSQNVDHDQPLTVVIPHSV